MELERSSFVEKHILDVCFLYSLFSGNEGGAKVFAISKFELLKFEKLLMMSPRDT